MLSASRNTYQEAEILRDLTSSYQKENIGLVRLLPQVHLFQSYPFVYEGSLASTRTRISLTFFRPVKA